MKNGHKENYFLVSLVQTGIGPLRGTCTLLAHGCCVYIQIQNIAKMALASVLSFGAFLFSYGDQDN